MSAIYYLRAGDQNRGRVLANLVEALQALDPKRTFVVEAKQYQKPRTDDQNKALWGCAYKALREQSGNDAEDLHEFFCGEFFGWTTYEVLGQVKKKPVRTTTHDAAGKRDVMSAVWFADFYDFLQHRSAENGFHVPDPDPMWKLHKERLRAAEQEAA